MQKTSRINLLWSQKHKDYMAGRAAVFNVAEGAVRAGKTIDNVVMFCRELETAPDMVHLASGSTMGNAKLNIGYSNGLGIECVFRGRCKWGKFKGNESLYVKTQTGQKVILFAGGSKSDSFKKIRGNSYGMWIATEINLHHDDFIKEAFNRQLAAKRRKIFWDLNPDNPHALIYDKYIDKYAAMADKIGGFNYQRFSIFDNINISAESIAQAMAQCEPGSVWYRRDILGDRCAAEGLCYQQFAGNNAIFLANEEPRMMFHTIGIDFGGSGSAHAFQCIGFLQGFNGVQVCDEWYLKQELTPTQLEQHFIDFLRKQLDNKRQIVEIRADSAEQVLINGINNALVRAGLPYRLKNAIKGEINERIRLVNRIMAAGRFKIHKHCEKTIDAFNSAMWDAKKTAIGIDERLDNGSSNIDTLDATEYAIEPYKKQLINYFN